MSVERPDLGLEELTVAKALEIERAHYALAGSKEQIIRERFGLSPVRYHQLLNRMLVTAEAFEVDPVTARMLVSRQGRRRMSRSA